MRKAVFLDRDGTIIDNQGDLGDPDGVKILHGAKEAISSLVEAGW
ncbi:MAG: HAD family hydrolase, partial [Planctomycetes bacterium]|nr:HAD family hydrolase [Planctomycetota bacterium]